MPTFPHSMTWLKGSTTSNGLCGYHSLAEIFVRMCSIHPHLIRDSVFDSESPVFKPLCEHLKGELDLKILTAASFSAALKRKMSGSCNESDIVFKNVVPALMLLSMNFYNQIILPARTAYQSHEGNSERLNTLSPQERSILRDKISFSKASEQLSFVGFWGADSANEQQALAHSLSVWFTGLEDEHAHMLALKQVCDKELIPAGTPITDDGVNIKKKALLGLQHEHYPSIQILMTLCEILFKPLQVLEEILRPGESFYALLNPCLICLETSLEEVLPGRHLYAIYLVSGCEHFQYALSHKAVCAGASVSKDTRILDRRAPVYRYTPSPAQMPVNPQQPPSNSDHSSNNQSEESLSKISKISYSSEPLRFSQKEKRSFSSTASDSNLLLSSKIKRRKTLTDLAQHEKIHRSKLGLPAEFVSTRALCFSKAKRFRAAVKKLLSLAHPSKN